MKTIPFLAIVLLAFAFPAHAQDAMKNEATKNDAMKNDATKNDAMKLDTTKNEATLKPADPELKVVLDSWNEVGRKLIAMAEDFPEATRTESIAQLALLDTHVPPIFFLVNREVFQSRPASRFR
jgi:pentapeptide MXKDX repeat protein